MAFARGVEARPNGIESPGCEGCHGNAATAEVTISSEPATFGPGDDVLWTVTIGGNDVQTAGVFVATPNVGRLSPISGEGLVASANGLTHSAPKAASGGSVRFRFEWQAPAEPGAVQLEVSALAANGDRRSSGDTPGFAVFSRAFGCAPQTYFYDADGDGFGGTSFPETEGCAGEVPEGFAENADDCNDSFDSIHPGAEERCNDRDDDCDDVVDDGANPEELWPDPDGDGFARSKSGASVIGCLPMAGYAAEAGDCGENDETRFPGAIEACNLLDDNCDGRVDERLRPQCGVGRCRRESSTCEESDCAPGMPMVEVCNLLDDDCDGEVDEAGSCATGQSCVNGFCPGGGGSAGAASATGGTGVVAGGASGAAAVAGGASGAAAAASPGGMTSRASRNSGGCRAVGGQPGLAGLGGLLAAVAMALWRRRRSAG